MENRRTTVYLDQELFKALKRRAADTDESISEQINEAIRLVLADDAEDLRTIEIRENESSYNVNDVAKDLVDAIVIKGLDKDTLQFLRESAKQHGQSIESEIRELLNKTRRKYAKPGDVFREINAVFAKVGGFDDIELPERTPMPDPISFS